MVFDGCERSMIEEKNIKRVFLRIFFYRKDNTDA